MASFLFWELQPIWLVRGIGNDRVGERNRKQLMHVNNSRGRELAHDEIEGTRVPDTDQSWGLGELLQLRRTGMIFGRQVDNII